MSDQKISDLSAILTFGLTDQWEVLRSGANVRIPTSALAQLVGYPSQGRLTTESGVPVSTSDRTLQGTIYFTPYNGNLLALYTASNWKLYTFSEISLVLSGLTSGKNYDVFVYDNSGTLTLELSNAWTNDTTRADAIAQQDGIDVKSSNHSRRLIGTIRTTGVSTTEDSFANRFISNKYNKVIRPLRVLEATNSWTYTTATWRQANGSIANQLSFVTCDIAEIEATVLSISSQGATVDRATGIGVDSTSTPTGMTGVVNPTTSHPITSAIYTIVAAGYHFLAWLEYSVATNTTTWFGDNGGAYFQSGITGRILN